MMNQEPNNKKSELLYSNMEDEFTLIDLWRVLARFKLAIFITVVVTTSIGVGFSFLMPKIFESRTAILVGKIDQVGLVEEPAVMVQRLIEEYKVEDDSDANKQLPYIDSVAINTKNANNIIEIKALGANGAQASQLLHQVEQQIIEQHTASYISVVNERRSLLEKS